MATPIPQLEELVKKVIPATPAIAKDIVTAVWKGWTRVTYIDAITKQPLTFAEPPTIVAVIETRGGKPPTITAPTIHVPSVAPITPTTVDVPSISLPSAPTIAIPAVALPPMPEVEVPEVSIPLFGVTSNKLTCVGGSVYMSVCEPISKTFNALDDTFVAAQNKLNNLIENVNVGITKSRKAVLDTLDAMKRFKDNTQGALNSYRDNIQNSVNAGLKDAKEKTQVALNQYSTRISTSINEALADLRTKTQVALNEYQNNIQAAVNQGLSEVIPKFYEQIGLPTDQLMNTVNIRNVTTKTFEFYALSSGVKLHYAAIGKKA